ncbi:MAG: metallopeptidase family protein [Armatimonadota bacterium]|nr:metallopeptidase family protein [Armatimonadota bacterium]MDR7452706.1 metallopeptidase family protein [Armatimonadota bacterium]MDR7467311.1 metallopeptidase family protein [Armatimonadota bacterium]MDR7494572.1 metallopeptidase family protein [Armatimonadota bacterium]MDR7500561.1 metallopeptidase family protein [Armatimonadota bacterium]
MKLSRRRFEALVARALDAIPEEIAAQMRNVDVVVEDWPSEEHYERLGLAPDEWLFGLYEGTPLLERGIIADPLLPDKITIFKGPLEAACETEEEIEEEIRRTVVHEVAHHFGIDEDRLRELGYD